MRPSLFWDDTQRGLGVTEVLRQPVWPILKGHAVQEEQASLLVCLIFEDGSDRLSRNVGTDLRCVTSKESEDVKEEYLNPLNECTMKWTVSLRVRLDCSAVTYTVSRLLLKCDGTHPETRFRLSAKRTSPFKWAGFSLVDYWQPRFALQR